MMPVEFDCADCGCHVSSFAHNLAGCCLECRIIRSLVPEHRPEIWAHFHGDLPMPEHLKTLEPEPLH